MINNISKKRISEAFLIIGITAVIIFLLDCFLNGKNLSTLFGTPEFKKGEVSTKTIVAPFDFDIDKDKKEIEEERNRAELKVLARYRKSQDATFQSQENIDNFFAEFEKINLQMLSDSEKVNQLIKKGYKISSSSFILLKAKDTQEKVSEKLKSELHNILGKGVIDILPTKEKIVILESGKENELNTSVLFTRDKAVQYLLENNYDFIKNEKWKNLILELLEIVLIENLIFDNEATKKAIKNARESIQTSIEKVRETETIVRKGDVITEDIYRRLQALESCKKISTKGKKLTKKVSQFVSEFIYIILVLSLFFIFFYFLHSKMLIQFSLFRISLIFTLMLSALAIVVQSVQGLSLFIIPFGMPIILLAFLIDIPAAIIFGVVNFFLLTCLLNWNFPSSFIISFSGLSAILALAHPRNRRDFYHSVFYIILFFAGLALIFGILKGETFVNLLTIWGWGISGAIISLIGSMTLLAPIEHRLPVITNIHLLELGDFTRPLLKMLSENASGTYHHSIIVGNLAEAAAKSIGANSLLARVGSYYHDIGKIQNPEYFIENSKTIRNEHENLTSTQSARILKKHVADGVKLAKENRIPKGIIDIIEQHHGNSQISYFYRQSKDKEEKIDENDFYYDYSKPQTKETAIVMIADIVESTTKSLDSPSIMTIKEVVQKTIKKLIENEQLTECGISLTELKILQESMIPILLGIYQKRIVYPE